MGSLMAGWDSHVLDSPRGTVDMNRSLTREEIENYWRSKRRTEEEHRMALPEPDPNLSQSSGAASDGGNQLLRQGAVPEGATYLERSKTFPDSERRFPSDEEGGKLSAWWTRSNWAFLNEPPLIEIEEPAYKYAAQYHIAAPCSGDLNSGVSRDGVASMS